MHRGPRHRPGRRGAARALRRDGRPRGGSGSPSAVEPSAVVGHSQGEIAAAVVAGALSLEDARQGRRAAQPGADRRSPATAAWPRSRCRPDGPPSCSRAGRTGCRRRRQRPRHHRRRRRHRRPGRTARRLRAPRHPRQAHPRSTTPATLRHIEAAPGPASSTPSAASPRGRARCRSTPRSPADQLDTARLDAEYWYTNLRRPSGFRSRPRRRSPTGTPTFLEISPHPVLTPALQQTPTAHAGHEPLVTGTLRRDEGGWRRLLTRLAVAHVPRRGPRLAAVSTAPAREPGRPADLRFQPTPSSTARLWTPRRGGQRHRGRPGPERGFWKAVEKKDAAAFAGTLGIEGPAPPRSSGAAGPGRLASRPRGRSAVDTWRYRVIWRPVTSTPRPARPAPGGSSSRGPTPTRLAGATPSPARCGVPRRHRGVDVDPATAPHGPAAAARRGGGAAGRRASSLLVADSRARRASRPARRAGRHPGSGAGSGRPRTGRARCGALTRGAVSAGTADRRPRLRQAQIWGLGRVVAPGTPRPVGRPDRPARRPRRRAPSTRSPGCWPRRRTTRTSSRSVPPACSPAGWSAPPPATRPRRRWRPRDTVLVTGGTGALGAHVARWLARERRRAPGPGQPRGRGTPPARRNSPPNSPNSAPQRHHRRLRRHRPRRRRRAARRTARRAAHDPYGPARRGRRPGRTPLEDDRRRTSSPHVVAGQGRPAPTTSTNSSTPSAGRVRAVLLHRRILGQRPATAPTPPPTPTSTPSPRPGAHAACPPPPSPGAPGTAAAWRRPREAEPHAAAPRRARSCTRSRRCAALQQALDHDETFVAVADVDWDRFVPRFTAARPRPLLADLPEARRAPGATATGRRRRRGADRRRRHRRPAAPARAPGRPNANVVLADLVRSRRRGVLGHAGREAITADRAVPRTSASTR